MRSLLLILVALAAAGGAAWLFLGEDQDTDGGELEAGPEAPGSNGGGHRLKVKRAPVIGVYKEHAFPLKEMNLAEASGHMLTFPPKRGKLTGADVLKVIEETAGRDLPIRFPNRASLELFEQSTFPMSPPAEPVDLPQVLEWFKAIDFVMEEQRTYLLVRPKTMPMKPSPDKPPKPKKPR